MTSAVSFGRTRAEPTSVGSRRIERMLAQQARAHDRRVRLPRDQPEPSSRAPYTRTQQLTLRGRVAIAVECGRGPDDPTGIAGELSRRELAGYADGKGAGRDQQHRVRRDRADGKVHRFLDGRCNVLGHGDIAQLAEQRVMPRRHDVHGTALRGEEKARARDIASLLAQKYNERDGRPRCRSGQLRRFRRG